jgi:hypothetical protein
MSAVQTDEPGAQRQTVCGHKKLTPDEGMLKLKEAKAAGRAPWWKVLRPEMHPTTNMACLQCTECENYLGASNPGRTAQEHFGNEFKTEPRCVHMVKAALRVNNALKRSSEAAELEEQDATAVEPETSHTSGNGSSSSTSSSTTVPPPASSKAQFTPPPHAAKKVREHITRFFLRNNLAMSLVEDSDLQAAFAQVGVALPTRKQLAAQHAAEHGAKDNKDKEKEKLEKDKSHRKELVQL